MKLPDLSFLHEAFRAKSVTLSKKILVDGGHDLILFVMHWTNTSQTLKIAIYGRFLFNFKVPYLQFWLSNGGFPAKGARTWTQVLIPFLRCPQQDDPLTAKSFVQRNCLNQGLIWLTITALPINTCPWFWHRSCNSLKINVWYSVIPWKQVLPPKSVFVSNLWHLSMSGILKWSTYSLRLEMNEMNRLLFT